MQNPTVLPSERIFFPQTVCVPATGVYIARAFNLNVPATKAEVLALAVDMGAPNGAGANFTKLAAAMKKRYGLVGTVIEGGPAAIAAVSSAVRDAVAEGQAVAVGLAGDQLNLTPHYQGNSVGHAIAVLYQHGAPGIQLDPLAPAGYAGDPFDGQELTKFARAAIIFKETDPISGAVKAATDPLKAQLAAKQAEMDALKERLVNIAKIASE